MVRTLGSHPSNRGSIPLRAACDLSFVRSIKTCMSVEQIDPREIESLRMTIEQQVRQSWDAFHSPKLKEQIARLTPEQKKIVENMATWFVLEEKLRFLSKDKERKKLHHDFVFTSVKPLGGTTEDGEYSGIEHHRARLVHRHAPKNFFTSYDQRFTHSIDPRFFRVMQLPGATRDTSYAQIIPLQDNRAIINYEGFADDCPVDSRGSHWSFRLLTQEGDKSIVNLLRTKSAMLLPYVARLVVTTIDPEAAVYCDGGIPTKKLTVIDFEKLAVAHHSGGASSGPHDDVKGTRFRDADRFVEHLRPASSGPYANTLGQPVFKHEVATNDKGRRFVTFFSGAPPVYPKSEFKNSLDIDEMQRRYPPTHPKYFYSERHEQES